MDLSTGTLITLGAVFLFFFILSSANRVISRIMMAVGICLVAVILLQAKTGMVLIDFEALANTVIQWGFSLGDWVQSTLLPQLTEVAGEIEKALL